MPAGTEPLDEKSPRQAGAGQDNSEGKLPWRNLIWLAGIAVVLLAGVYLSPLRDYQSRIQELSGFIQGLGWWAPFVFTTSVAALVALGFPRLLLCVLAGMAFGFWPGLIWAQTGTLIGNYAVFVVARSGGKDWAERYFSKHAKVHTLVEREGIPGVILARQLPVPGLLINLACGLFGIRRRDFLIGTIIGQLPEAVPCTLIGAGVLEASFKKSVGLISVGVGLAVLVWIALRWGLKKERIEG
jgi:uncharacterized membrane protein YdjX (TVP38/TMEM64 family)